MFQWAVWVKRLVLVSVSVFHTPQHRGPGHFQCGNVSPKKPNSIFHILSSQCAWTDDTDLDERLWWIQCPNKWPWSNLDIQRQKLCKNKKGCLRNVCTTRIISAFTWDADKTVSYPQAYANVPPWKAKGPSPQKGTANAVIGCCRSDWRSPKQKWQHWFFIFLMSLW